MKKIFSLLLALVMLISMLPVNVSAETSMPYKSLQLNINWSNIKAVGKQAAGSQSCACFALAYARTLLDNKVHYYSEYNTKTDQYDAIASWTAGSYAGHYPGNKSDAYKRMYSELCGGNPVIVKVKGTRSSHHYVTIVGFENVTSLDALSAANFLIIDPGVSGYAVENLGAVGYDLKYEEANYQVLTDTTNNVVSFSFVSTCTHTYSGAGVCSKCGYTYPITVNTSDGGIYKVLQDFVPRTDAPYDAATKDTITISAGAKVEVLGSVTNAYNNKWYKISYESGKTGYVYHDRLQFVEYGAQEITCTITSPKEGEVVPRKSYPLAGTVTSKYPLKKVEAYIDGNWFATVILDGQYSLDLRSSQINTKLDFAALEPGNHSLVIKAHDIYRNNLELIIRRNFVTEGSTAEPVRANVSQNAVNLALDGATSETVYVWATGDITNTIYLDYQTSNTSVYCTWGEWNDEGKIPLTITAREAGTTDITVSVKDYDTDELLASTVITATVTAPDLRTVWFDANGGAGLSTASITAIYGQVITIPEETLWKFPYTFRGWSNSLAEPTLTNVVDYFPGSALTLMEDTTLYATWQLPWPFPCPTEGGPTTLHAPIAYPNQMFFYLFTPTNSGYVNFYTACEFDTYIRIYDESGNQLRYDDDSGDNFNFSIQHYFEEGKSYYLCVNILNGGVGFFDIYAQTIVPMLNITQQPKDAYTQLGKKINISVVAEGEGLTYDWYVKDVIDPEYVLSSIKTATYAPSMTEDKAGRYAYCVITDKYGNSVKTDVVRMWLTATITQQPVSVTVAAGAVAKVTVQAVGDGLSYRWYYKNPGASSYTYTSSFKGNTYSVTMNEARNGRQVLCRVYDAYGNVVQTNTVKLSMKNTVKIIQQPVSVTVAEGQTARVTIKATGDGLTYRWYYKDIGMSSYTYTSSYKSNTYSVTMNDARNGRQVLCRVYDAYGNVVQTNTVKLSMKNTVKITQQPTSVTVAEGETARVTVKATGDGLTYRWYYKNAGESSYTYTSSFKGSTYYVTMNDARNGRWVLCRVYDKYGNVVQTNTVILRMS